jgi:predicted small lipoprotein YifL
MMRATLSLLLLLSLTACGDKDDSATPEGDTDTDSDTDADGDTDADTDADADTDIGWEHCPDAADYVGDEGWTGLVEVGADAVYCGGFNEGRTLEQELATKALLRMVEGSYALPTTEGEHALALPFCVRRAPQRDPEMMDGAGSSEVALNTWSGTTYTYLTGTQPALLGSDAWSLGHTLRLVGDEGLDPEPLVLDGGPSDATTGAGGEWTLYPQGGSEWDVTTTLFTHCSDPDWHNDVHNVVFDGGEITLALILGLNTMATAPGRFTRASGELDGTAFEVDDYFQLVYRPEHHHFVRHFAVVFDEPIGEVCALRVEEVDPWEGDPTAIVSTADCDLVVLEERAVSAESYVSDKYE